MDRSLLLVAGLESVVILATVRHDQAAICVSSEFEIHVLAQPYQKSEDAALFPSFLWHAHTTRSVSLPWIRYSKSFPLVPRFLHSEGRADKTFASFAPYTLTELSVVVHQQYNLVSLRPSLTDPGSLRCNPPSSPSSFHCRRRSSPPFGCILCDYWHPLCTVRIESKPGLNGSLVVLPPLQSTADGLARPSRTFKTSLEDWIEVLSSRGRARADTAQAARTKV